MRATARAHVRRPTTRECASGAVTQRRHRPTSRPPRSYALLVGRAYLRAQSHIVSGLSSSSSSLPPRCNCTAAHTSAPSTSTWSVVIPTHNRLSTLQRCLDCLHRQKDDGLIVEVIVVDDASTDGTWAYLQSDAARERYPKLRPLHRWENGGASAARNDALRVVRGHNVLFVDDDLFAGPELVRQHHDALEGAHDAQVSLGVVVDTPHADVDVHVLPQPHQGRSAAFFATGNCAVRVSALRDVASDGTLAAFDESFTAYGWEDLELGERLQARGVRAVRPRGAYGYHYQPRAWDGAASTPEAGAAIDKHVSACLRREVSRGAGAALFVCKHPFRLTVWLTAQLTALHAMLWASLTLCGLLGRLVYVPLYASSLRWEWRKSSRVTRLAVGLCTILLSFHLNWLTTMYAFRALFARYLSLKQDDAGESGGSILSVWKTLPVFVLFVLAPLWALRACVRA
ncbi:glycosyltransferase family 2 protein [Pseudoscourfieldia marina]